MLTASERTLADAKTEAYEKARDAQAKVTVASSNLMELKSSQEKERLLLRSQNEKLKRETAYAAKARVQKARKASSEMLALAEAAEKRRHQTEGHVAHLEAKIRELKAAIENRAHSSEVERSRVQRVMNRRLEEVSSQAEERVRGMAEHAKEVCVATDAAIQATGAELQEQIMRASMRSEGRTRLKELGSLTKSYNGLALPKDAYLDLRENLVGLWQVQAKTAADAPRAWREKHSATPDVKTHGTPRILCEPATPQKLAQITPSTWCESPPSDKLSVASPLSPLDPTAKNLFNSTGSTLSTF